MSFINSQIKHQTDWGVIQRDPHKVRTRFPRWIYQHDPERYAYEKFGLALNHLMNDEAEFHNTNFPPGHRFEPWTIEDVKRSIAKGESVEEMLDGDWT